MRLLFVNYLHPDTLLVGAMRLLRFAEELARRGHQVLLLCANHRGQPDTPETVARRIASHDWSTPLLLAVRDDSSVAHARASRLARPLRRLSTATNLVWHGGSFWRWQRAARQFHEPIVKLFAPELAYATFGNLDALAIARAVALRARIPWIMDIKDPAENFLPASLRTWIMSRFRDAAAVTLNAEFQRSRNLGWADANSIVIYSGVEAAPPANAPHDPTRVALIGSIYDDRAAAIIVRGFAAWRQQKGNYGVLHYFGVSGERVARIAADAGANEWLVIEGQIPKQDLLERCQRMAALTYVGSGGAFHHKLLELAVLGRPLVVCPAESEEALALCRRYGIPLVGAPDEASFCAALMDAAHRPATMLTDLLREHDWAASAAMLERIFLEVVSGGGVRAA